MEIRLYYQMLQRGWWIILLAALVALTASLALSYSAIPQYQASARFIISPNPSIITGRDVVNSLDTLDRRSIVSTYAEVMNSRRIYESTLASLNLSDSELKEYTYNAVVLPDSSVLELLVTGPSPKVAAVLANALGEQAIAYTRLLNQVYDVNFLDTAVPSSVPVSPQPLRDAALALAIGAVLGGVLVILREQIRTPIDALRRRTMIDTASSAYSRRYFERTLEETLARSPSGNVSLGLIQLDRLGDLVDTLPPVLSQDVLHEISRRLRNELRGNDVVGRWGTAEFSVMLPSTPAVAAERTMQRVRQALSEPFMLGQTSDTVQMEAFTAMAVSQPGENVSTLIERAESSLGVARSKHIAETISGRA
ncbi:MAG: diguanylate cyclase domain-containing protein [Chloroflexota bacterium]